MLKHRIPYIMPKWGVLMKSIKRGRGPSFMNGVGSLIFSVLGILMMLTVSSMSSDFGGTHFFLLFLGMIVLWSVCIAIYNFKNASGKNRYSEYDVTDSFEEPDPLNQHFSATSAPPMDSSDGYCPYCGAIVQVDFEYCARCGRRLPN